MEIQSSTNSGNTGETTRKGKISLLAQKIALAAICVIPPADLVTSDAISAKIYQLSQEAVHNSAGTFGHAFPDITVATWMMAQSVALGVAIAKTSKLRGAMNDMEGYLANRQSTMSPPRKFLSRLLNAPLKGLAKLGTISVQAGERISKRGTRTAEKLGSLAMDLGQVNVLGTSGMALSETIDGKPPSISRLMRLSGLITATWVGGAEAVRSIYETVPGASVPLSWAGHAFETMTNINSTIGASVIVLGSAALANFGWQVAKFHEQNEVITR